MDAAEHLIRQTDAVGAALGDAFQRRAAGTIDAGEADDVGVAGEPGSIGGGARGAATGAGGGGFVDPRAVRIAVDAGRGEVAEPLAPQRIAVAGEDGVGVALWGDRGEDMAGSGERGADGGFVVEA